MEKTHVINQNDSSFDNSIKPIVNNMSVSQYDIKDIYALNRINSGFNLPLNSKIYDYSITESDIDYSKSKIWFDIQVAKKISEDYTALNVNASIQPFVVGDLIESISVKLNNSNIPYFQKNNNLEWKSHFMIYSIENKSLSEINASPQYATPFGYSKYIYNTSVATDTAESVLMVEKFKERRDNIINVSSKDSKLRFSLDFDVLGLNSTLLNVNRVDIRIQFKDTIKLDTVGLYTLKVGENNGSAFTPYCVIVDNGIQIARSIKSSSEIAKALKQKGEKVNDILSYIDNELRTFQIQGSGLTQITIPSLSNVQSIKIFEYASDQTNNSSDALISYTGNNQTFIGNSSHTTALDKTKYSTTDPWSDFKVFYGSLCYPLSGTLKVSKVNLIDIYHEYVKCCSKPDDVVLKYSDFCNTNPMIYMSLFNDPKLTSKNNINIQFNKSSAVLENINVVISRIKTVIVSPDLSVVEAD